MCDVLQTLGGLGLDGEAEGDAFLTVSVAVEDNDAALSGFTDVHDAEVKAVGGKAQGVVDADGELAEEGFLAGDAGAGQREV